MCVFRYVGKDDVGQSVACPLEDVLVFDCEIVVRLGPQPILATAITPKAWYVTIANTLADTFHICATICISYQLHVYVDRLVQSVVYFTCFSRCEHIWVHVI